MWKERKSPFEEVEAEPKPSLKVKSNAIIPFLGVERAVLALSCEFTLFTSVLKGVEPSVIVLLPRYVLVLTTLLYMLL